MRNDTAYDLIKNVRNTDQIKKDLIGITVRTSYNKKTYRVADIDFNKTPKDTFARWNKETGKDEEISYADYLKAQYKI